MYLMCMQDEPWNTCSSCSRFLLISFYMVVLFLRIFPFPHSEHAQSSHRLFIHNNKRLKIDQTSATSGQHSLTEETTHRLLRPPLQVSFNWVADVVAVADCYRGPGDDPPCKQSTPPWCEKTNDSWGPVTVLQALIVTAANLVILATAPWQTIECRYWATPYWTQRIF